MHGNNNFGIRYMEQLNNVLNGKTKNYNDYIFKYYDKEEYLKWQKLTKLI